MRLAAALAVLALAALPAAAQEFGFMVRQTEVKAEPFADAAAAGTLPERAKVQIVKRQGAWMQVKGDGAAGWVRMLAVRTESGSAGGAGSSGLASIFSFGRGGSSGTAVATGVRGLDKEQIRNATPNPNELARMKSYAASRADAERFGASAPRLASQRVDYVASASAPAAGGGGAGGGQASPLGGN